MTLDPSAPDAAAPRIDSREAFAAALRWGVATAIAQRSRRIVCCDADFTDWPVLDDPEVLRALTAWLKQPQRRLVLLARSYDALPRRWPRFTAWRHHWLHAIDARQPPEELATELPTVLVADNGVSVELIDALHWRGRASVDARRAHRLLQEIDAVLQRSDAGFAANVLGL